MIKSNLLKILITFFIFSSCSSSNDTPETLATPVGKWQLEQHFKDGSDVATDCTKRTTLELKSDNTVTNTNYYINSATGNCNSNTANATYSIEGEKLNIKVSESNINSNTFEVTTSKLTLVQTISGVLNKIIFKKI